MTTNQGWTITSDITYPGTRQLYASTGADGSAYIDGVFVIGETYEFTMITTGMAGTGALFLLLVIKLLADTGTFVFSLKGFRE